jgi:hypothetical protein
MNHLIVPDASARLGIMRMLDGDGRLQSEHAAPGPF